MDIPVTEKPPLVKYGYAPGKYYCTCIHCKTVFDGDKQAVCCETCATSQLLEDQKT